MDHLALNEQEQFLPGTYRTMFFREYFRHEVMKKLVGQGGLVGYLGTNDAVGVEKRINGDEKAN